MAAFFGFLAARGANSDDFESADLEPDAFALDDLGPGGLPDALVRRDAFGEAAALGCAAAFDCAAAFSCVFARSTIGYPARFWILDPIPCSWSGAIT